MASNSFGNIFRWTSFGESHGEMIGVVIDGFPSKIPITEEEIYEDLKKRRPGKQGCSPRKEQDLPKIISGVYQGKTTGAPICVLIQNEDVQRRDYEEAKQVFRPGHASYTYFQKYGHFDPFGGGRASARETAMRTVAAAFAKKLLPNTRVLSFLKQMGPIQSLPTEFSLEKAENSPIYALDKEEEMLELLSKLEEEGDSVGGVVECVVFHPPPNLGDPIYEKLEANLAKAMLSIPASKGIEFGEGFSLASKRGSQSNDQMQETPTGPRFMSNHHGGILGGISTGEPILFRVAFKPTSSIKKPLSTTDFRGNQVTFAHPKTARHDPCVAIRATKVVESMTYCVLADAFLYQKILY